MDDKEIHQHLSELIEEERELRSRAGGGHPLSDADQQRIAELELQLDQLWDLLRRRQAREEFGDNPDIEQERPPSVVENYLQ